MIFKSIEVELLAQMAITANSFAGVSYYIESEAKMYPRPVFSSSLRGKSGEQVSSGPVSWELSFPYIFTAGFTPSMEANLLMRHIIFNPAC